jgi:hypothetical protein
VKRYEVRIFPQGRSASFESAELAYGWLDEHATAGEQFTISAVTTGGGVTIVDYGSWQPQPPRVDGK